MIGDGNRLRFLLIAKQCRSSEWARWPWNDLVWLISAGGAAKRVDELATAFPHRNAETMIIVIGGWTDPDDDEPAIAMLREWYYKLDPFTGGYYDNIDFDGAEAGGNYGPAYERLQKIKGKHDPSNLFRLNSNIEPVA